MGDGFTKLYNQIITSSVWSEDDKTRIMWITMLASADANGHVSGSIPGMAAIARMSLEDAERTIKSLCSPDLYSRTKECEGRRLIEADGGWFIVNYAKYRQKRDPDKRREQNREAKRRQRKRERQPNVSQSQPKSAQAEAEAEAERVNNPLTEEIPVFTSKDFIDAGVIVGLTPQESQECFDYYKGQQFQFKPGIFIRDAQDACVRWRNHRGKFGQAQPQQTQHDGPNQAEHYQVKYGFRTSSQP